MGSSTFFGAKAPALPHLVRGTGGLAGEINDLRSDIDEAFVASEAAEASAAAGGFLRVDHFVDPATADPDGVKLSFASSATATTYGTADFDGAGGASLPSARGIVIVRSASAGAYTTDAITITGTAYGEDVTLTFTPANANGGDTISSTEDFGLDTITSISIPAQVSGAGAFTVGWNAELALFRGLKDLAGVATPLREVIAGAVVTTGTFTGRRYLPTAVSVPDGVRDYAVAYIADPAG